MRIVDEPGPARAEKLCLKSTLSSFKRQPSSAEQRACVPDNDYVSYSWCPRTTARSTSLQHPTTLHVAGATGRMKRLEHAGLRIPDLTYLCCTHP